MRINNVIRHKGIKNTSFLVCLSFAWLCLAHSQSFIFPSFAKAQSDAGIIRNICKECDKTMYSLFACNLPKRHEAIKIENGGFVFDCRAMPNPYWDESLCGYTGRDKPITDFFALYKDKVDCLPGAAETLVRQSIGEYLKDGRDHLQVAFGCTGGQHRSVYFAERMAERLTGIDGVVVEVTHVAKPFWKMKEGMT